MKKNHYILMADIIRSSKSDQFQLMEEFRRIVNSVNSEFNEEILSPFSITLGDEFQGVCHRLSGVIKVICFLKEQLLVTNVDFRMRYVCVLGEISTPINTLNSYGMLGPGLTKARKLLNKKKRKQKNFRLNLKNKLLESIIQNSFEIMFQIESNSWKNKEKLIIKDLIFARDDYGEYLSDSEVARRNAKGQSQVWKYRKTGDVESFRAAMKIVDDVVKEYEKKSDQFTSIFCRVDRKAEKGFEGG